MNFDEYSNMLRMFKHYFIYESSVDKLSKYQVVALMILFTLCKKLLSLILCWYYMYMIIWKVMVNFLFIMILK